MAITELKVVRIGNSRGVRLPAKTLLRHGIGSAVVMEDRSEGILLRPTGSAVPKLSWEATARAMATAAEEWREFEVTAADGLEELPWEPARARRAGKARAGSSSAPKRLRRT